MQSLWVQRSHCILSLDCASFTFPVAVTDNLTDTDLGEEGLDLAHSLKGDSCARSWGRHVCIELLTRISMEQEVEGRQEVGLAVIKAC